MQSALGAAAPTDNVSETGTTITEDGSQAISEEAEPASLPTPPAPPPQEVNLLGFDDEYDSPAAVVAGVGLASGPRIKLFGAAAAAAPKGLFACLCW
jgi:hypothetical protein